MLRNVRYRGSDRVDTDSQYDCQPVPTQSSDVILLETEQCLEPLPDSEPCSKGFLGQWFLALREMYPTSDRKGKQILATAFGAVGLIGALAIAAWSLPPNAIGLAVACGLVPLPLLVVYVWHLIIVSKN
jgi:hypothetical protein